MGRVARSSMNSLIWPAVTRPRPRAIKRALATSSGRRARHTYFFPAFYPVQQGFGPGCRLVFETPRECGGGVRHETGHQYLCCLLYTSDAADDLLCVDLGGR